MNNLTIDFDQAPDRRGTDSYKWDTTRERFGRDDVIPMWVADMDFAVTRAITDALAARVAHPVYGYTAHSEECCDALIAWLEARHGWRVPREAIMFSPPGAVYAIHALVAELTEPGDEILVFSPGYEPLNDVVSSQGRHLVVCPLRLADQRYEIDPKVLAVAITPATRMLILCSPHNPTGRVWTGEELMALARLCRDNNIFVVSDEVHCDLVYAGYKHIPFGSLSGACAARSITCVSPNKTFNTSGLPQASLLVPCPEIRARLGRRFGAAQTNLDSPFSQAAMIAAYRQGGPWLDALIQYLAGNLATLRQACARMHRIKLIEPQGTYLAWLDCRELAVPSTTVCMLFARLAGVGLYDGSTFGPAGEGFLRMNIACPHARLSTALSRIEAALS